MSEQIAIIFPVQH